MLSSTVSSTVNSAAQSTEYPATSPLPPFESYTKRCQASINAQTTASAHRVSMRHLTAVPSRGSPQSLPGQSYATLGFRHMLLAHCCACTILILWHERTSVSLPHVYTMNSNSSMHTERIKGAAAASYPLVQQRYSRTGCLWSGSHPRKLVVNSWHLPRIHSVCG